LEKYRKSVDAGIIDIIVGLMITAIRFSRTFRVVTGSNIKSQPGPGHIITDNIRRSDFVYGGVILQLRRRNGMKRTPLGVGAGASICASLLVFGIPSLILTILSKK